MCYYFYIQNIHFWPKLALHREWTIWRISKYLRVNFLYFFSRASLKVNSDKPELLDPTRDLVFCLRELCWRERESNRDHDFVVTDSYYGNMLVTSSYLHLFICITQYKMLCLLLCEHLSELLFAFSFCPGCFAFWCCPCFACRTTKRYGQCLCLPLLDIFGCIPPITTSMRVSMRQRYGIKVRPRL